THAQTDYSADCLFTVDQTPPDKAPTVKSTFYPENGEGGSPGLTGPFTFTANGVADVGEFVYRLSGGEEHRGPAGDGTAPAGGTRRLTPKLQACLALQAGRPVARALCRAKRFR